MVCSTVYTLGIIGRTEECFIFDIVLLGCRRLAESVM